MLAILFALVVSVRTFGQDAAPAENPRDKALEAELIQILNTDQAGRLKIDAVAKEHGQNSPEMKALWQSISEQDAINLARVKAILDVRGWLGPDVIGGQANTTLFLVIQHSDTATQQKYLPLMREAVKQKKAQPSHLALLEDRVALAEGRPQTYGSQLRGDENGKLNVSPLIDPDHVDERRASVGLPPMAEYLKHWNLTWDLEEYKKHPPSLNNAPTPAEKK